MNEYYHSDENKFRILDFIEEMINGLYKRERMVFMCIYGSFMVLFLIIFGEFGILSIIISIIILVFFIILYSKLSIKIKKLDILWDCINHYF